MLIVFPGQGSQRVGMGKDIYENFKVAKAVFDEVDDAISFNLSKIIFEGDIEELTSTENAQPALMTVSMALVRVLQTEFGFDVCDKATFFAGHSLGEYSALCASKALSLSDTAKILRQRGKAMAEAYPSGGAMAAILGLDIKVLETIVHKCSTTESSVQIANDNSSAQIVISGHEKAVNAAMEESLKAGAKRAIKLQVSGPFHSCLMESAVEKLREVLSTVSFNQNLKPIIANFTANAEESYDSELLLKQITGRVRWRESMLFAQKHGVTKCVEIGEGRVLTGLAKKTVPDMATFNINSMDSLKEAGNTFSS
ncbi:MAG: ACP S-malonyltransferase [Alphaproteobacteria bacterium]|nr:ACP S-malonyltransferase [Alphaproteobacteria bacterium]